jgi:crotonobetainyl-CoA:carnitine CoA-transferase CaiB-like acyl-CoA transferase
MAQRVQSTGNGPLTGLRVLDCTHVMAGAWCSMILADLGADVVKIEPPKGEVTRGRMGAFRAYDFLNRNKRAIAVDMSKPEGVDLIKRLAKDADVWVENFRPGALDRLGLGYEALSAVNPSLIYASISGFGQDGPYRERGGLDLVAQAMSGIMSFVGNPGGEPASTAVPIADLNAGTFAAVGILAAWAHRVRTGEGQRVETSLLESALAYTAWESGLYLTIGDIAKPQGSRHRLAAPYEALKTKDGYIVVGVNHHGLWLRFCEAIGDSALAEVPLFANGFVRVANREELKNRIETILQKNTTAHWLDRLLERGIPAGPINNIAEALNDPQVKARGMLRTVGDRKFLRTPLTLSLTPVEIQRGAAEVGEHTREVLLESGLTEEEADALFDSGGVSDHAVKEAS